MPHKRTGELTNNLYDSNKLDYLKHRIKFLRKEHRMTQKELGNVLGVTQSSIYFAEKQGGPLLIEAAIYFYEHNQINPAWVIVKENKNIPKFISANVSPSNKIFIPKKMEDFSDIELIESLSKQLLFLKQKLNNK